MSECKYEIVPEESVARGKLIIWTVYERKCGGCTMDTISPVSFDTYQGAERWLDRHVKRIEAAKRSNEQFNLKNCRRLYDKFGKLIEE